MLRLVVVVGARPNLMKAAPLLRAMCDDPACQATLIHTGQHYDASMSGVFFDELRLPRPQVNLGIGSAPHGVQTGQIMQALEPVIAGDRPDAVVVVGDVNSTMAAAIVAAKLGIPVAHVEAGLRSFDRSMPEEINRLVTDAVSDYFFTTSRESGDNLRREGVPAEKIFFVGNVMIDSLLDCLPRARAARVPERFGLAAGGYAVLTLHRPSSVDKPDTLNGIVDAIGAVVERVPIVFPAHPRTVQQLKTTGLDRKVAAMSGLRLCEPLGYADFLGLLADARLVLTDSGGVQEETTVLGVPCLTLRDNTERPETVTEGTNRLVGTDPERILAAVGEQLAGRSVAGRCPELWDGQAAVRITRTLVKQLTARRS